MTRLLAIILIGFCLAGCLSPFGANNSTMTQPTPTTTTTPPQPPPLSLTPLVYLGAGMVAAGALGAWLTKSPTALVYGGSAGGGTITIATLYGRYEWAVWVVAAAIVAAFLLHIYLKRTPKK